MNEDELILSIIVIAIVGWLTYSAIKKPMLAVQLTDNNGNLLQPGMKVTSADIAAVHELLLNLLDLKDRQND
jgi:cytochrome b561